MNIRKVTIVLAVLVIIGAVVASRFLTSSNKGEEKPKAISKKSILQVNTLRVKNRTIDAPITVTGKLAAPNKVEIFAEVSGVLKGGSLLFKEGSQFPRGSILINIDDEEARLNLLSQKSQLLNSITQMMPDLKLDFPDAFPKWQTYLDNFDVNKSLEKLPEPDTDKEKYYVISRDIHNQFYSIKSQESRLRKYHIYAPFSGVVAESNINPGTLVRVGQKLGEFINPYSYELEALVSIKDIDLLKVGDPVRLTSVDISGNWKGTIKRINTRIDPNTQTVKVFIATTGQRLKEGMFLNGEVSANQISNAVSVPRNLLIDADKVYIVEDSRLKLRPVQVIRYSGNNAIIKGLEDKTLLLNESSKDFYEGMEVKPKKQS